MKMREWILVKTLRKNIEFKPLASFTGLKVRHGFESLFLHSSFPALALLIYAYRSQLYTTQHQYNTQFLAFTYRSLALTKSNV
jgi:hypothetical protein